MESPSTRRSSDQYPCGPSMEPQPQPPRTHATSSSSAVPDPQDLRFSESGIIQSPFSGEGRWRRIWNLVRPTMAVLDRSFTFGLVISWYASNIGVLLLNKYLLSTYGFKYPIFLTYCHMWMCSLLSYITIAWMELVPLQAPRSWLQLVKIVALCLFFCGSVVSNNISLRYLPVSFNQALGATTPFFTAVFAYFMTLKREAVTTYVTLIPVVVGVMIASGGEPSFHLFGFLMCIGATATRALKSVLQGILLSSEGEKLNSMNLLLYMSTIAVVLLVPATLLMEKDVVGVARVLTIKDTKIIWYLLFNSSLAYFLNLTNFLVTKHTSALTLQVLGNAKGAVALVSSILIFKNPVSVTGMMGYGLTVIGVILYSETKKRNRSRPNLFNSGLGGAWRSFILNEPHRSVSLFLFSGWISFTPRLLTGGAFL